MSGIRFQRGNHIVADLDRALTLYRGVLGFDVTFTLPHNPHSSSIAVCDTPPATVTRSCVLSTDTQERVMALTEVAGVELAPVPHTRRSAIVLEIDDPDTADAARADVRRGAADRPRLSPSSWGDAVNHPAMEQRTW